MKFSLAKAGFHEAYQLSQAIPEFSNGLYGSEEYKKRLGSGSLVLIASYQQQPVGFKAGYPRGDSGRFYSWMGAVLPDFRRRGVARILAEAQESWAKDQGYQTIWFKSRNRNRAMIMFALSRDFLITGVQQKGHPKEYRVIMEKEL